MTEQVNHPSHYNQGVISIETIEIIDLLTDRAAFDLGNAIKYICRAPHKGTTIVDLEKALWYIDDYIIHASSSKPTSTLTKFEKNQLLKLVQSMKDEETNFKEKCAADILQTLIYDVILYNGYLQRTRNSILTAISTIKELQGDSK